MLLFFEEGAIGVQTMHLSRCPSAECIGFALFSLTASVLTVIEVLKITGCGS
jgi:hypothetical protein